MILLIIEMMDMNKNGFTIAEVIVSFVLVSIILASMVGSTVYYRERVKEEEVVTQLIDFKNTITTLIYDDVLVHSNKKISRVEKCVGISNCVNFVANNDIAHTLRIEYNPSGQKKGAYLSYDGKLYMLPDSDLSDGDELVSDFVGGFEIDHYEDTLHNIELYTLKTSFKHKDLDKQYDIMITLTNQEVNEETTDTSMDEPGD